jgi:single-stranded-DNA-specific exonuclease
MNYAWLRNWFKLIQVKNRQQTTEDLVPYLDLLQQLQRILFLCRKPRISSLRFASNQFKSRPGIKALVHQVKKQTLDITDVVLSLHQGLMLDASNMVIMLWNC